LTFFSSFRELFSSFFRSVFAGVPVVWFRIGLSSTFKQSEGSIQVPDTTERESSVGVANLAQFDETANDDFEGLVAPQTREPIVARALGRTTNPARSF
jgi:hypothetical protein